MRKTSLLFIALILIGSTLQAQQKNTVSATQMERIYQEVKTPYKYGLVMVPNDTQHKMDCPTIFRKGKYWYMTYLIYGGRGYETWLAKSKDLLNWENLGRQMSFSDTTAWDENQKAGYNALTNTKWGGNYNYQLLGVNIGCRTLEGKKKVTKLSLYLLEWRIH